MKGRRGGFTVTEMLTAVGILAVLTAAAVPAVITLRADLKMRELDDTAREIFLAAQNSLTARRAAGVSLRLGEEDGGAGGCYWLSSEHPDLKTLLPAGSVEGAAASNPCMIWYNAGSAAVLEVYYAEGPMEADKIKGRAYSDSYNASHAAARREARIGYYNGSGLDRGDVEPLAPPLLTIKNGDELTVTVTVPHAPEYAAAGVALTVTVEELDQSGKVMPGKLVKFERQAYLSGGAVLVLDSLDGDQFKTQCPSLTPGADIRVTAALTGPADGEKTYLPSSARAGVNSLFLDRSAADGRDTLSIAYARHLQNLEPGVSGLPVSGEREYCAVQTQDIEWSAGKLFRPIGNQSLRGYGGNGNRITNLRISCDNSGTGGAGLFGLVTDAELRNIRLVDPVLIQTGPSGGAGYVGALAGILQSSRASGCQVYATGIAAGIDCAGRAAGGLVGLAEGSCEITNSSASLPTIKSSSSNASLGGLIGLVRVQAGRTGSVSQCYADTGWMGGGRKWRSDYGLNGSAASIGGLIGEAWSDGIHSVTDCYALGWFSGGGGGTLVGRISGVTSVSNCYSILQSGSGNYYSVNQHSAASLSALTPFTWSGTIEKGGTTAYHPEVCPGDYPYPRLSLRHYGDWPVQTADGVKLYQTGDPADQDELHFILAPAGENSVAFYAEARNGEDSAMQAVESGENGPGIAEARSEYDGDTGRTEVTLTFREPYTGVTYADLKAGEVTLRAVVVRYAATVTLTGTRTQGTATPETAVSTASSDGSGRTGTLTLSAGAKTGVFTAEVKAEPSLEDITDGIENLPPGTGDQIEVSVTGDKISAYFGSWNELRAHDPSVTANGDPDAGTNILELVNGGSPAAGDDGKLTVTGAASGTAIVSARWAMDERLKADCEVRMAGARALIERAEARGPGGGLLGEKGGYPYRLDLTAEPEEKIDLTFTPRLFGGNSGAGGTYTWEIRGTGGAFSSGSHTTTPETDGGVWSYQLTDASPRAAYAVTLAYTDSETGERSVDFMTFSVYRAARKSSQPAYRHIQIAAADPSDGTVYGTFSAGDDAAAVEQICSDDREHYYPNVDKLTLQGWVENAGNTQVRWSVSADSGATWQDVTGHNGPVSVFETMEGGAKRMRATVEWLPKQQTYGGDKIPTGGAVRITGKDANEYDEPFSFLLRAEAVESIDDSGDPNAAASKTVTVTVMPQLQIDPLTFVGYTGRDIELTATRGDKKWPYRWSISHNGEGTTFPSDTAGSSVNFRMNAAEERHVTLRYGPHTAYATVKAVDSAWEALVTINWDMQAGGTDYFLVEKGESRALNYSWFVGSWLNLYKARTTAEPPKSLNCAQISYDSGTPLDSLETIGERAYSVTGTSFGTENVSWTYQHGTVNLFTGGLIRPYSTDHYNAAVAVTGMDVKQGDTVVSDTGRIAIDKPGHAVGLTADWFFPGELIKTGPDLTWTISNSELVSFVDGAGKDLGAEVSGKNLTDVTLQAHKYSAKGYTVTLEATCRITAVNDREYTFTKLMEVTVPPQAEMTVTLTPCTGEDIADMRDAFEAKGIAFDLPEGSPPAAVDRDGNLVLINNPAFGCGSVYLKASAELPAGEDLEDYFCNIYTNEFYADVESALSTAGKRTVYIRVKAKEANKDLYELTLHAAIGSEDKTQAIHLYGAPTVKLTQADGQGGTVDVTNGSRPVYLNEKDLSVTLTAALEPTLYRYEDADRTWPLNALEWVLETSAGYEPYRYLTKTVSGNTVTVGLISGDRMPDFRVVLRARSVEGGGAADAGYALVFLPEEKPEEP